MRLRELHPAEEAAIDQEQLRELWPRAQQSGLLAHRSTDEFLEALRNYLDPMQWLGRRKGPFPVDRHDYEAVRVLRNEAAHPTRTRTVGPPHSARDLQWVARFTNSLWEPESPLPFAEKMPPRASAEAPHPTPCTLLRRQRQRRHAPGDLTGQAQGLAAGGEEAQRGAARGQRLGQPGTRVEQVLAIVQLRHASATWIATRDLRAASSGCTVPSCYSPLFKPQPGCG